MNPEYEALLPKLSKEDYEMLKESIRNDGLHYAIVVNKEGVILDGHHRFKVCIELGIEVKFEVKEFPNVLLEKRFVIVSNLDRRHLDTFQRAKLVLPLLEIEKVLARERQSHRDNAALGNISQSRQKRKRKPLTNEQKKVRKEARDRRKAGGIIPKKPTRARTIVANKARLSDRTLEKVKTILEKGSNHLKDQLDSGQTSIDSAYQKLREAERQAQVNTVLKEKSLAIPEGLTLLNDDFTLCNEKVTTDSIQLILTDPPYSEEYLDLWEKLGVFANRVLVSGGFLVSYCPHFYLPTILNSLSKSLEYFWTIALIVPQHRLIHSRHVFCDWKPLIVFNKPPRTLPQFFGDLIKGEGMEKDLHEWQQGEAELSQIIETFCPPNGIVLDPMAGSGTTLAAAKKLNRKAIGIEKDPATFEKMKVRLAE